MTPDPAVDLDSIPRAREAFDRFVLAATKASPQLLAKVALEFCWDKEVAKLEAEQLRERVRDVIGLMDGTDLHSGAFAGDAISWRNQLARAVGVEIKT